MIEKFPEIYRYLCLEMKPKRLWITFTFVSVLSICIFFWNSISRLNGNQFEDAVFSILLIQFLVLSTYGAMCSSDSISSEHRELTWDFQRLTGQSSTQFIVGKFIGVSLYPCFIALCFWLWAFVGWIFMSGDLKGTSFFYLSFHMFVVSFTSIGVGLFVSAFSKVVGQTRGAGAVIGFALFYMNVPFVISTRQIFNGNFFGLTISFGLFAIFLMMFLFLWAVVAAKWKVGEDFLEKSRSWRLPVFIGTAMWIYFEFSSGFFGAGNEISSVFKHFIPLLIIGLAICYLTGFFGTDNFQDFKTLWRTDRFAAIPGWVIAWVSASTNFIAIFFIYFFLKFSGDMELQEISSLFYIILFYLMFCLRDLILIQFVRLIRFKNRELAAFLFLLLFHFSSAAILSTDSLRDFRMYFFLTEIQIENLNLSILVPLIFQIIIGVSLLFWRLSVLEVDRKSKPQEI